MSAATQSDRRGPGSSTSRGRRAAVVGPAGLGNRSAAAGDAESARGRLVRRVQESPALTCALVTDDAVGAATRSANGLDVVLLMADPCRHGGPEVVRAALGAGVALVDLTGFGGGTPVVPGCGPAPQRRPAGGLWVTPVSATMQVVVPILRAIGAVDALGSARATTSALPTLSPDEAALHAFTGVPVALNHCSDTSRSPLRLQIRATTDGRPDERRVQAAVRSTVTALGDLAGCVPEVRACTVTAQGVVSVDVVVPAAGSDGPPAPPGEDLFHAAAVRLAETVRSRTTPASS